MMYRSYKCVDEVKIKTVTSIRVGLRQSTNGKSEMSNELCALLRMQQSECAMMEFKPLHVFFFLLPFSFFSNSIFKGANLPK